MANKTATFKVNLTYEGPGSTSVTVAQKTINVPFGASCIGEIDLPADVADGNSFSVPFGTIATGASAVYLINNTTQDLEVKYNGGLVTKELAPGGALLVCADALPVGVPLTAVALVATATPNPAAVERVSYFVFGDPE